MCTALPSPLPAFLSTPSARRATSDGTQICWNTAFLSTPSARRATSSGAEERGLCVISIHALREEGDQSGSTKVCMARNFYQRPPRGGRPIQLDAVDMVIGISIHALREEGDAESGKGRTGHAISIHALREEGDLVDKLVNNKADISIHALREEGDMLSLKLP